MQLAQAVIHITRREPNFDRACEEAYRRALVMFGCDDYGHLRKVPNFDRSSDCIVVEFHSYRHIGGMGGQEFQYEFHASVERDGD